MDRIKHTKDAVSWYGVLQDAVLVSRWRVRRHVLALGALFFCGAVVAIVIAVRMGMVTLSFGQETPRRIKSVSRHLFFSEQGTAYGPFESNTVSVSVVDAAAPQGQCADGTLNGHCSLQRPWICTNGLLQVQCSICGCIEGMYCSVSGDACISTGKGILPHIPDRYQGVFQVIIGDERTGQPVWTRTLRVADIHTLLRAPLPSVRSDGLYAMTISAPGYAPFVIGGVSARTFSFAQLPEFIQNAVTDI